MPMLSLPGSVTAIRLLLAKESCLVTGTMRFVLGQALHGGRTPTGIVTKRWLPLFMHSQRVHGLESAFGGKADTAAASWRGS